MTAKQIPAFHLDTLYAKSQTYVQRGLRAKHAKDIDEYQLWASLALELLGKAALANVSPALVADPTHYPSLFAACGIQLSTDLKTITAKTLFERLQHIQKDFDSDTQEFCQQLALRRNAELHSGESPFSAMALDAWEKRFWYAVHVLLAALDRSLEAWIGAEAAKAPLQLLKDAAEAIQAAVTVRVLTKGREFVELYPSAKKRAELVRASLTLRPTQFAQEFTISADRYTTAQCPACEATGILAGVLWSEDVSDEVDPEYPWTELVEMTYLAEEFYCPTCGLRLGNRQEIAATALPEEFSETEEREREFEPDYGND